VSKRKNPVVAMKQIDLWAKSWRWCWAFESALSFWFWRQCFSRSWHVEKLPGSIFLEKTGNLFLRENRAKGYLSNLLRPKDRQWPSTSSSSPPTREQERACKNKAVTNEGLITVMMSGVYTMRRFWQRDNRQPLSGVEADCLFKAMQDV
jgi:hypothetical protein